MNVKLKTKQQINEIVLKNDPGSILINCINYGNYGLLKYFLSVYKDPINFYINDFKKPMDIILHAYFCDINKKIKHKILTILLEDGRFPIENCEYLLKSCIELDKRHLYSLILEKCYIKHILNLFDIKFKFTFERTNSSQYFYILYSNKLIKIINLLEKICEFKQLPLELEDVIRLYLLP
jgi:hypothetical protein